MSLCGVAFAAPGDLTVDGKVTVTGFSDGDTVTAYQFVTWDADNNQWKVADGLSLSLEDITDGLTKDELATLANEKDKMTPVTGGTATNGTWELTCGTVATAGSYLVLVADSTSEHIYNPAVVSADFKEEGNSVTLSDTVIIKKQNITVEKDVDNEDDRDVQVGDIVPFTVTVTVPQYNSNWTEPTFEVKDQLSTGLTLEVLPTIEGLTQGTDYTLDGTKGGDTFTITFTENYLKNNPTTELEIKYSAKVGEAVRDTAQVHEESNTVTLTFSNDPTNKESHKEIEKETHHYTFAIDAFRFGSDTEKTGELIKVGVDQDGNPITSYQEGEALPEKVSALEGAEFTLTGTGANNTGTYSMTATSDASGRLFFNNLEAGTYTLTETKAPAGYIKDSNPHTVVISAEYNDEDGTLQSYSISIDGEETSSYTATTKSDKDIETIVKDNSNKSFPINNKKGAELPSTGGIGTTIFYISGIVLVLGAAAILVARRKAEQE
jgi:fimbrial isopeptide formation D2 family protein/LPXTG-motif cell wall-anchored protein